MLHSLFKGLFLFLFIVLGLSVSAQRGLILNPATTSVMDPNGDGFIYGPDGFSTDGYYVDEFELDMFGLPISGDGDVVGDTQAGPDCGTTDLTVDIYGHSSYASLDASNNLIFRFRLADASPSVEAYTVLLDTDGAIGDSDPNSNATNPGFEIDITLIKNASQGVKVYNIDGVDGCPTPTLEYDYDSHFQLSIADLTSCGDEDYFYDFFVPFDDLIAAFPQLNLSLNSKIQFASVTNISGTCAMAGKISDIGGVDDSEYAGCNTCAFLDLSADSCPVSLSELGSGGSGFLSGVTEQPTMNLPLKEGDQIVSGTATAESDIYLNVYDINDDHIEEVISLTDASGIWDLTLSSQLVQGDSVTVIAQSEGMCDSGATGSQLSFAVVVLNTTPVIDGTATVLPYAENDGAVPADNGILLTDNEDVNFQSALVWISGGYIGSEDALNFSNQSGISGTYDAGTGTLSLSGEAAISDYQIALRSIAYINGSEDPDLSTRTISFQVNDGTENSNVFTRDIELSNANDAPVIAGISGSDVYNWTPQIINSTLSISDPDNTSLSSATITIGNNFSSGDDDLIFTDQNGINGSYDVATGVLSLSGNASLSDYASALNSVQYENTGLSELTRRFDFVISDGIDASAIFSHFLTMTITNSAPIIVDESDTPIDDLALEIDEDGFQEYCVQAIDADGDNVIIDSFIEISGNGTITLAGGLCFEYEPDPDFNGDDSFTVTVCDQNSPSLCDDVIVTITVNPINDPAVVQDVPIDVDEKVSTEICVAFTDIEGDSQVFASGTSLIAAAEIVDDTPSDLCFSYTPPNGFIGEDQVEVTICDSSDGSVCSSGIITINVIEVNEAPIVFINGIAGDNAAVNSSEDIPINYCFSIVDPEGDNVAVNTISNISGGGNLIESATAFCFDFSPVADFNGESVWEIEFCDDNVDQLCKVVTLTFDVAPVNDPATLQMVTFDVDEKITSELCVSFTDIETDDQLFSSATSMIAGATIEDGTPSDLCFNYSPPIDFIGSDQVEITICDAVDGSVCSTETFTVNVIDINEPPTVEVNGLEVTSAAVNSIEDISETFCFDILDPEGDNVTTSSINNISGNGTLVEGSTPFCYDFNPVADFNGESVWEIEFCDDNVDQLCKVVTLTFNVAPVNDPATLQMVTFDVDEKITSELCVSFTDIETDDQLFSSATSMIAGATIEDGTPSDLCFNYSPPIDFIGSDQVEITICDAVDGSVCSTETFTVNVIDINEPPTVEVNGIPTFDIVIDGEEDTPLNYCLTLTDPEGDGITINSITNELGGGNLSEGSPSFCMDFIPELNYYGSSNWSIEICDDNSSPLCAFLNFSVAIAAVNDAPVLSGPTGIVSYPWEPVVVNSGLSIADVDDIEIEGAEIIISENYQSGLDFLQYSAQNGIMGTFDEVTGKLVLSGTTSLSNYELALRSVTFYHSGLITDTRQIDFLINDGEVVSNILSQQISLVITNTNPEIIDETSNQVDEVYFSVIEDEPQELCFLGFDADGDIITLSDFSILSANGEVALAEGLCFDYTPELNFNGEDTFEFTACDDGSPILCDQVIAHITVLPINDTAIITSSAFTVNEKTTTEICLSTEDIEGDSQSYISGFSQGGLSNLEDGITGDLCFMYTPNSGLIGQDLIEVTVCDSFDGSVCTTTTLTINVIDVNDAPEIVDETNTSVDVLNLVTNEDEPFEYCILAIDPDGDELTAFDFDLISGNGIVSLSDGTCINYLPDQDFFGQDSFSVTICDDGDPVLCDEVTINLEVLNVNDNPVATPDLLIVNRSEEGLVNVLSNDTDVENDQLSLNTQVVSGPYHGLASLQPNGEISYQSFTTYRGLDSLMYELTDDGDPIGKSLGVLRITVEDELFTVYQAISPNGDGANDYWHIEGIDYYSNNRVRIYDRYNNLVYEVRGYNNLDVRWNGHANKKGNSALDDGTYFYFINLGKGDDGSSGQSKGFIVLKN